MKAMWRVSPLAQFDKWFKEALSAELPEPNAMTLATCDAQARPSARIVLIKGYDERGFVYFTNYESHKAQDLAANNRAPCSFSGPSWSGRSASRAELKKSAPPIRTITIAAGHWPVASAPGLRRKVRCCLHALLWRRASLLLKPNMVTTHRARPTGAAIASCRRLWSSGKAAGAACMIASSTASTTAYGKSSVSPRRSHLIACR